MTTFAEMLTATYEVTRRPELADLTTSAIRTATLRAHHIDFFPRDLNVAVLPYSVVPTQMFYDFPNISASLPRFRNFQGVFGLTLDGFQVEQLEYRDLDDRFDNDGQPRRYIYCLIGNTLRCWFDMPTGQVELYYFQNPDVSSVGYSSWIADMYKEQLAQWAAAIVLMRTGFREIAAGLQESEVSPFKEQLLASHLIGNVT